MAMATKDIRAVPTEEKGRGYSLIGVGSMRTLQLNADEFTWPEDEPALVKALAGGRSNMPVYRIHLSTYRADIAVVENIARKFASCVDLVEVEMSGNADDPQAASKISAVARALATCSHVSMFGVSLLVVDTTIGETIAQALGHLLRDSRISRIEIKLGRFKKSITPTQMEIIVAGLRANRTLTHFRFWADLDTENLAPLFKACAENQVSLRELDLSRCFSINHVNITLSEKLDYWRVQRSCAEMLKTNFSLHRVLGLQFILPVQPGERESYLMMQDPRSFPEVVGPSEPQYCRRNREAFDDQLKSALAVSLNGQLLPSPLGQIIADYIGRDIAPSLVGPLAPAPLSGALFSSPSTSPEAKPMAVSLADASGIRPASSDHSSQSSASSSSFSSSSSSSSASNTSSFSSST
jgi:hypothetical protein